LAAGYSYGKCAAGPGERRDFQGRHGAGNLRAAHVRNVGADDGAAEGGATESRAALWAARAAGEVRGRFCKASGRTPGEDSPLSQRSAARSEEHTSELQSHLNLVCRLLLEEK